MACLRLSIGCFVAVGLVAAAIIVVVVVLFGVGASLVFSIPDRASRQAIESAHQPLLAAVRARLSHPDGVRGWKPPAALVALRQRVEGAPDRDDLDLLTGARRDWGNWTLINDAGIGTIEHDGGASSCLIYAMTQDERTWWLYIVDPGPPMPAGPEG
jgi:hypothetical protein